VNSIPKLGDKFSNRLILGAKMASSTAMDTRSYSPFGFFLSQLRRELKYYPQNPVLLTLYPLRMFLAYSIHCLVHLFLASTI
jgi:hypothetical protein